MPAHSPCPSGMSPDRKHARVLGRDSLSGWARLCNGVIVFDDTGCLLATGQIIPPHRPVLAGEQLGLVPLTAQRIAHLVQTLLRVTRSAAPLSSRSRP